MLLKFTDVYKRQIIQYLNFNSVLSLSDKLFLQKSNYLTEDEIREYIMNCESDDEVSIFD